MSPSTAMLIFTLLHTSAVNNEHQRRSDSARQDVTEVCAKFTNRREIREFSNGEIEEIVAAIEAFNGSLNFSTLGESLDTVVYEANSTLAFPYWDFRLDSQNPFESALLTSMGKSRFSTSNSIWVSKLLSDFEKKNEIELLLEPEIRDSKNKAQQWIQVLQFGNLWQAMLAVMIEEYATINGTESYDFQSPWLYRDNTSMLCYSKTKIGGKCSSSEMCYGGICAKGYCRLESAVKASKKTRSKNSTTPASTALVKDNHTTLKQSKTTVAPRHAHNSIQWNETVNFPTVYLSVTVIEGKLRKKKRTQRWAEGYRIETIGGNVPQGYNHVLEGSPQPNSTNALVRVLSPENILPFVKFRLNVFNKHGEKCRQRCLSTRHKGYYRRCKRDAVMLTMYESYSDPVEWYKTENELLSSQWTGRGYYRKRKLDYLLFKCNP